MREGRREGGREGGRKGGDVPPQVRLLVQQAASMPVNGPTSTR